MTTNDDGLVKLMVDDEDYRGEVEARRYRGAYLTFVSLLPPCHNTGGSGGQRCKISTYLLQAYTGYAQSIGTPQLPQRMSNLA